MNADLLLSEWPRWMQMWTLALAMYIGCKAITWQATAVRDAAAWKHVAYLVAWPGMDATAFLATADTSCAPCRSREWLAAAARLASGVVLLFGVARQVPPQNEYLAGWIGMIGIVLILHFGAFHLLSCWWRGKGVTARPLMNRPLTSVSLGEFWGRRWNTAFRDLTHRLLFRPFAAWFGTRGGILAGFLFSGAIHDLVISLPARGGYGGPTAYFAIQGAAMLIERSAFGQAIGLGSGWRGRAFAIVILIAPVTLLFHRPFVAGIIIPFMHFLGAL
jgi:Membrane bound O-acyl transferase family